MIEINGPRKRRLSKKDRMCRKIIEYGILGLIIFSPLPAASVHEWSILIIQLSVLTMMGAYLLMKDKPSPNEYLIKSLRWPKYLFIGFFMFLVIQIIPLPKFILKIISPNGYLFLSQYLTDFQNMKFLSISLIPSHSFRQALELLAYFLLGYLIIKTVTKRQQFQRILSVLIGMGVFQAFYGLFELYNNNPRILFYKKIYALDSVTGTFVNRNHLSGYLEMAIPLAIGLIIARVNLFSLSGLKWREIMVRLSEKKLSVLLLTFFGIILMCLGIIFSKSRSGIFLMFFSFILFFGFTVLYFDKSRLQKRWIETFLILVFLGVTLISLQIGISASMERFAMDDLLREGRPIYWANTMGLFSDFPLIGMGLGTFTSVYPDWEVLGIPIRLYHAHNDYLEYLSELGVIGMTLLLGGILLMGINSFIVWRKRKSAEVKGLALGGLVAVVCILVHSITDFNLHIPANMILFTVVLSLTAVIAYFRMDETK